MHQVCYIFCTFLSIFAKFSLKYFISCISNSCLPYFFVIGIPFCLYSIFFSAYLQMIKLSLHISLQLHILLLYFHPYFINKIIFCRFILYFIIIFIITKFFTVGIVHSYKKANSNQLFQYLKSKKYQILKKKKNFL